MTIVRIVLVVAAAIAGLLLWGPATSGAWILLLPSATRSFAHGLPSSYAPLHEGHVDLATGLYIRQDQDIVLRGTPPFILTRTYSSQDPISRQFGVGAAHNGEWYLRGDGRRFQWAELILPEAKRIHFDRISTGSLVSNALYENRQSAEDAGARLGWLALFWGLRWPDGRLALFKPCGTRPGDACSLTRLRDSDGHWTVFARDDAGMLRTITAGAASIGLEYDATHRIVRAADSTGAIVTYAYDDGGRLTRVEASDGAVRSYGYDDGGNMLTVSEPHHAIENTFVDGRCVRQVSRLSDDYGRIRSRTIEMAYATQADGRTTTEVRDSDGLRTIWEFDRDKYQVGATYYDDTGREARAAVERDPVTHGAITVTVACLGPDGPITLQAAAAGREGYLVAGELLRRECAAR